MSSLRQDPRAGSQNMLSASHNYRYMNIPFLEANVRGGDLEIGTKSWILALNVPLPREKHVAAMYPVSARNNVTVNSQGLIH